jgi:hypothetical protein
LDDIELLNHEHTKLYTGNDNNTNITCAFLAHLGYVIKEREKYIYI